MFGVVNNDAGVNAAAALLVFLLVRGLRRGLSCRSASRSAPRSSLLPAMKATGAALYPAALVGIAGMVWRRHAPRRPAGYAALAGAAAAALVVRAAVVAGARGAAAVVGGRQRAAPAWAARSTRVARRPEHLPLLHVADVPAAAAVHERPPHAELAGLRRLHQGAAGPPSAGWWSASRTWVYVVIVAVSLAIARARAWSPWCGPAGGAPARGWELAVLVVAIAGVVGGVEAAYFTGQPRGVPAEQGRYIFTALVPLAAIAVGGALAFRERVAPLVAAGLVAAVIGARLRVTAADARAGSSPEPHGRALALAQRLAQPASTCRPAASHEAAVAAPVDARPPSGAPSARGRRAAARSRRPARPGPARRAPRRRRRPSSASVLPPARSTHGSPQAIISWGISE